MTEEITGDTPTYVADIDLPHRFTVRLFGNPCVRLLQGDDYVRFRRDAFKKPGNPEKLLALVLSSANGRASDIDASRYIYEGQSSSGMVHHPNRVKFAGTIREARKRLLEVWPSENNKIFSENTKSREALANMDWLKSDAAFLTDLHRQYEKNKSLNGSSSDVLKTGYAIYKAGQFLQEWIKPEAEPTKTVLKTAAECWQNWVLTKRKQYEQTFVAILEALADEAERESDFEQEQNYLEQLVALVPTSQKNVTALMKFYRLSNRIAEATTVYEHLQENLRLQGAPFTESGELRYERKALTSALQISDDNSPLLRATGAATEEMLRVTAAKEEFVDDTIRRELNIVEQFAASLSGPVSTDVSAALQSLREEYDSIIKALEICSDVTVDEQRKALGLQITKKLFHFWNSQGGKYWQDGQIWLERMLDRTKEFTAPDVRAGILNDLAILEAQKQNFEKARYLAEQSYCATVDIENRSDMDRQRANAFNTLGFIKHFQVAPDPKAAQRYYLLSKSIFEELGLTERTIWPLLNLATIARESGNFAEAEKLYVQCLNFERERRAVAFTHYGIALMRCSDANVEEARVHLEKGLRIFEEVKDNGGLATLLSGFAVLAAAKQCWEQAIVIQGGFFAWRRYIEWPLWKCYESKRQAFENNLKRNVPIGTTYHGLYNRFRDDMSQPETIKALIAYAETV